MPSPIYLQVCAGLANRLRAAISGICGAEDLGRSIVISWPTEPTCAAKWSDLFDTKTSDLPSWISIRDFVIDPMSRMCLTPEDWETESMNDSIVIKSYGHFYQKDRVRWITWLRRLKPHPEMRVALSTLFGNHGHTTVPVGVHIRRTDHITSIKKSPTEAFIQEMKKYSEDTRFFVATDDEKEWDTLLQIFPKERLIRASYDFRRNTRIGIQNALLDFLGLSSCREILGSAGSSFSDCAAAYGGIPLLIMLANLNTLSQTSE